MEDKKNAKESEFAKHAKNSIFHAFVLSCARDFSPDSFKGLRVFPQKNLTVPMPFT